MSFSRAAYDPCAYKRDVTQSVGVGTYSLETPRPHCDPCFSSDPSVRVQRFGAATAAIPKLIDVDSDMMGLTRRYTRCPEQQYSPHDAARVELTAPKVCDGLAQEDTRGSNPPCTLRCMGWNRWEWLREDPQRHAIPQFPIEVQYRLIAKDNHKPVVPSMLDQSAAYPPGWRGGGDGADAYGQAKATWLSCGGGEQPFPATTWRSCTEIARM